MSDFTVNALVVCSNQYGESDRILTLFSAEKGHFEAKARGVRKMTSKNAAALDLFCFSNVEIAERAGRYTVKMATLTTSFKDLAADPTRFAAACYFAEACRRLCGAETPEPAVLRLLLNALFVLQNDAEKPPALIKAAFEFKLCALLGFLPDLTACAHCGEALDERHGAVFSFAENAFYAEEHASRAGGSLLALSAAVMAALRFIASNDVNRFTAFRLADGDVTLLALFAEKYLLSVAETAFPTLKYYRSLTDL